MGDRHAGLTRRAGTRDRGILKGTEIDNDRQWSAVSKEELDAIAEQLGLSFIDPGWLGANLTVQGIPDLTKLPQGTKLVFPSASLLVMGKNLPCIGPGKVIERYHPQVAASKFPKAAWERRGLIGKVETPGIIRVNDHVKVIYPTRRAQNRA